MVAESHARWQSLLRSSQGQRGAYCSVGIAASYFAESVRYFKIISSPWREYLETFRFRDVFTAVVQTNGLSEMSLLFDICLTVHH